jgi:hypothetical protein
MIDRNFRFWEKTVMTYFKAISIILLKAFERVHEKPHRIRDSLDVLSFYVCSAMLP